MANRKINLQGVQSALIAIIGDVDTVTGFLLTGIGERNTKGELNYLVVNSETKEHVIEETFKRFLRTPNIAIILVTQQVIFSYQIAEKYLRHIINEYDGILPTVLEIPSKEIQYEARKDSIMQRAHKLLYGSNIV